MTNKPIVLTGLMGSGKSALGAALAQKLGLPFYDADAEIEKAAGKTISQIFAGEGEAAFRALEKQIIKQLVMTGSGVIATGGGAVLDADTRKLLKEQTLTIWLQADVETLATRIGADPNRPLLKDGTPREKLAALLAVRESLYAQAHHTLRTDEADFETTLARLLTLGTR